MRILASLFIIFFSSSIIFAQVGIGTTTPDASAELDISSTSKGILIPRMTLTQRSDIDLTESPTGALIYQTDSTPGFYYYDGVSWEKLTIDSSISEDADWYEVGSTISPDNINDNIFTQGYVAIGKNTADYPLDVLSSGSVAANISVNGTTSGDIIAVATSNSNTENGNHSGVYNTLSGLGSGYQYGTQNEISNEGSGVHYGVRNYLHGNGTGYQIGTRNQISNTGHGNHYGTYNSLSGGQGHKYGTYTSISSTAGGEHCGAVNSLSSYDTASSQYGAQNSIGGSSSGGQYGTWTKFHHYGTGNQYGIYNIFDGDGSGNQYGSYTYSNNSGGAAHHGSSYNLAGGGSGLQFGTKSVILNSGDNTHYGSYSLLQGSGSGDKYGFYSEIWSAAGGTHYGIYSNVETSNGWAGYFEGNSFFSNNVGIGTTSPGELLDINGAMHLTPGAAPATPNEGDIYMDASSHKLRCYDGTTWQNLW